MIIVVTTKANIKNKFEKHPTYVKLGHTKNMKIIVE